MQKYCDIVGEEVDKEDCAARKEQAQQFREQGQPHASLEKCVEYTKMTGPDVKKTAEETNDSPAPALICSHCKRGPGAIASRWVIKRGMHQSCYQNQETKKKRPKKVKSKSAVKAKPATKPPKKPPEGTKTFNVGDIVKHRASGKKGIIAGVSYTCEAHPPISMCAFRADRTTCKLKRNGFYTLNLDFNEDIKVHETFIEKANANKTRR